MRIKDIRQYRLDYKKSRQSEHHLEEYVGARYAHPHGEVNLGFFDLIHGDKGGSEPTDFKNFLRSFLEMATDGQAVYEFLQNAVDAGSSEFFIRWGSLIEGAEPYVLIVNNGKPFDLASVRAILNIGMGTKTRQEDANSYKIGKFGIGFKLAHRLVEESNGLDELISDYQGPILFSWSAEDWKRLADKEPLTFDPSGTYSDNTPWFFKILLTCFPCQPGDDVFDIYLNPRTDLWGRV